MRALRFVRATAPPPQIASQVYSASHHLAKVPHAERLGMATLSRILERLRENCF